MNYHCQGIGEGCKNEEKKIKKDSSAICNLCLNSAYSCIIVYSSNHPPVTMCPALMADPFSLLQDLRLTSQDLRRQLEDKIDEASL